MRGNATIESLLDVFMAFKRGGPVPERWLGAVADEDLVAEVAEQVLEEWRDWVNPRVIKPKMSNWRKQRLEHRHYPPGRTSEGFPVNKGRLASLQLAGSVGSTCGPFPPYPCLARFGKWWLPAHGAKFNGIFPGRSGTREA